MSLSFGEAGWAHSLAGWCAVCRSLPDRRLSGCQWRCPPPHQLELPACCGCRYLTGHTTRGVWLSFFLAQAPIIVAERLALSALKRRGILLPDWLRVCVSMLLVVATAQHLFWAPCKKHGVADSVVNNVHRGIQGTMKSAGLIARA